MGRVARYKKIKSCDPYSKQNGGRVLLDQVGIWGLGDSGRKPKKRSKTSEKMRARKKLNKKTQQPGDDFDAPPTSGDDFDLADLVGSLKKERLPQIEPTKPIATVSKTTDPETSSAANMPPPCIEEDEEVKAAKLLKIEKQLSRQSQEPDDQPPLGRMEGETKRAYHKRVKAETRQIIKNQKLTKRNPEKKKRKKEFLNNKKKKKQKKSAYYNPTSSSDDDLDNDGVHTKKDTTFVTGEQAVAARARETAPQFGEQAERPPEFRQLPRGASKKKAGKKTAHHQPMDPNQIAAEQEAMERIRRKVQAQYSVIKSKRRNAGDFHL